MIKKTINFTDFDGNPRTEDFYFNLTVDEIMELQFSEKGGLAEYINTIIESDNNAEIYQTFKKIMLKAIGKKSEDGRQFVKSEEIKNEFSQTNAFSTMLIDFMTNAESGASFIEALIPLEELNKVIVAVENDNPNALQTAQNMLEITIPRTEYFDSKKQEFGYYDAQTLKFEHSLISISKWESKWTKPFLTKEEKSPKEISSYIQCMCITPVSNESVFSRLTAANQQEIVDYISAPMTATWFNDRKKNSDKKIITSEVIYAQMIGFGIPVEFEK